MTQVPQADRYREFPTAAVVVISLSWYLAIHDRDRLALHGFGGVHGAANR